MFRLKSIICGGLSFCLLVLSGTVCAEDFDESQLKTSVYERPYSLTENEVDTKMLTRNTVALVGTGIATMGILYLMPSSFTNWEDDDKSPAKKWWDNVSGGPVWDKDDFFLNYVTHPYAGAIYYMGARSAGVNAAYSFLYSFALSTFFWECGIEAFAEKPSIQDLIVTPVTGALFGEWFYLSKRSILEDNRKLWGSRALGQTALLLMDPMTEISEFIWGDKKPMNDSFSFTSYPFISRSGDLGYTMSLSFRF